MSTSVSQLGDRAWLLPLVLTAPRRTLDDAMTPSPSARTLVALFADAAGAQRAADDVVRGGMAAAKVHLHQRGKPPRNAAGIVADEYLTGGFFANFASLLGGLLNAPPASDQASTYADVLAAEGAAVSVEVNDEEEAGLVEATLRQAGATKVVGKQTSAQGATS